MKYEVTVGETTRVVDVEPADGGKFRVSFDGEEHLVDLLRPTPDAWQMLIDGESWEAGCVPNEGGYLVDVLGLTTHVGVIDPRRKALRTIGRAAGGTMSSQMPGRVVKVMVAVGDVVKKGQPVLVVEAMKMENELKAPTDGTIGELFVKEGDAVETGAKLLRVDA